MPASSAIHSATRRTAVRGAIPASRRHSHVLVAALLAAWLAPDNVMARAAWCR
jgi:hypothetical protein